MTETTTVESNAKTKRRTSARFGELLDAASELFERNGYEGTGLREIADAANLLKGSVYYYIDNKEDLLFEIVLRAHLAIGDANTSWLDVELAADPLAPMRAFVQGHVRLTLNHRVINQVLVRETRYLSLKRAQVIADLHRSYENQFRRIVQRALDESALRSDVTMGFAVNVVFTIMNHAHSWFNTDGTLGVDEFAERVSAYAISSLL